MARHYDRIIRFYSSWFADLMDEDKGFTADERWQVLECIWRCQMDDTTDYLDTLPAVIRRGLQLATLKEQIDRMLERSERMRSRSSRGGQSTAASRSADTAARSAAERDAEAKAKEAEHATIKAEIAQAKAEVLKCLEEGKEIPKHLYPFAKAQGLI